MSQWFAVDCYTDNAERAVGPFASEEDAEAWCEKEPAIGLWTVVKPRTIAEHREIFG